MYLNRKYVAVSLIIAIILLADQVTKWAILEHVGENGLVVTSFFNLVLVWNKGISFGMFNDGHMAAPILLSLLSLGIVTLMTVWLVKTTYKPLVYAIAVVISGAIGNVIDRLRFGAVVDFLDVHAFGYHWPAFNVADSAVVLGIAFIVIDGLFFESKRTSGLKNDKIQADDVAEQIKE